MDNERDTENPPKKIVRTQWRCTNPSTLARYPYINDFPYTKHGAHMIDIDLPDLELAFVIRPYLGSAITVIPEMVSKLLKQDDK